jgi:hypothetical protein
MKDQREDYLAANLKYIIEISNVGPLPEILCTKKKAEGTYK